MTTVITILRLWILLIFSMKSSPRQNTDAFKLDPSVTTKLLHCWKCNQTDGCKNLTKTSDVTVTQCLLDEAFCAVMKYHTVNGDIAYGRGCQKNCKRGCTTMSQSNKQMKCTSCCSNTLCNFQTGNANATFSFKALYFISIILIIEISVYVKV